MALGPTRRRRVAATVGRVKIERQSLVEGPYRDAPMWIGVMESQAAAQGKKAKRTFLYYTTCPRCAKHYGKNYVVGFAEI